MKIKLKFTKLTAAQKRVAIAKDVLKQILAKTTRIKSNQYWKVYIENMSSEVDPSPL